MQDLFKSSIRLEEDSLASTLGALMDEDGLASVPGTSPDKGGLAPTLEANPGTPARLVGHAREPRTEIAAITGQPGSDTD
jgi:hypothetical protein